jgi:hypothetical protein
MRPSEEYCVKFRFGHLLVTVDNKKGAVPLTVYFHSCGTPCNCIVPWICQPVNIPLSTLKSHLEDAIKLKHHHLHPDEHEQQVPKKKVRPDTAESWLTLGRWLMVNPIPVKCVPGLYECLCSYSTELFYPYEITLQCNPSRLLIQQWAFSRRLFDMHVVQEKPLPPSSPSTDTVFAGTSGLHSILHRNNPKYIKQGGATNSHGSLSGLIAYLFGGDVDNRHKKSATWVLENRNNLEAVYTHCGPTLTAAQILNNAPFTVGGRGYDVYARETCRVLTELSVK